MSKKTNKYGDKIHFRKGSEVYWHDPDDDVASGYYTITEAGEYHCTLKNEAGSEVQAFYCELS